MAGTEIRGWELVNTVDTEPEPGLTERIYVWEKKGSAGRQLIRIAITEAAEWRRAQAQLQSQLGFSMRPGIPRAKGRLAKVGDVSFAAAVENSRTLGAVYFVRGNLAVTVASAGEEPVDVAAVAARLDRDFSEPPTKRDLAEERAVDRSRERLEVRKLEPTRLAERLPTPVLRGGWLKVIVPDGEIAREGDELIYRSPEEGPKRIQEFVIIKDAGR
jgi:hypothetical protein